MDAQAYLIFHLNLAFSSIEEEKRPEIIDNCYHPLLRLVEKTGIPVGIELSGWTLRQIQKIDPSWIERFSSLLNNKKIELIGSGHSQIIGPLVPHNVNTWNQKLGLEDYQNILGIKPKIALVNEMAFSDSLVDLYLTAGYKGLIMDRDNIRLALGINKKPINQTPCIAKGVKNSSLPVLWADSILFQKLQQYIFGDITYVNYLEYLMERIRKGDNLLPIYANDAEIFDHRPGRFKQERLVHPDGEWNRLISLVLKLTSEGINWLSPSQALDIFKDRSTSQPTKLTSIAHPIPVKKQAKYNIGRWAVTGKDDFWLNTMCHRVAKHFSKTANKNPSDWLQLCEFWSSDLRTHITTERWEQEKNRLEIFLDLNSIPKSFEKDLVTSPSNRYMRSFTGKHNMCNTELNNDDTILKISNKKLVIELNLRRGLAIQNLAFSSHDMEPSIGTLPHGYFSSIEFGADYYSGGTVIEIPRKGMRMTDLEAIQPEISFNENQDIVVDAQIKTNLGVIYKTICISSKQEEISLTYNFFNCARPIGSIRLGTATFFPSFFSKELTIFCANGGLNDEHFKLDGIVDHGSPSSTLVSSSRGFGATNGSIGIGDGEKSLLFQWDPGKSAVMPMLQNIFIHPDSLTRVFFSLLETDETSRKSSRIGYFNYTIKPN